MGFEGGRHRVSIAGRVFDGADGGPMPGARVSLAGDAGFAAWLALKALAHGPAWDGLAVRPDRAVADADGRYRFADLPAGTYAVTAAPAAPGGRHGTASASVTVPAPPPAPIRPADAAGSARAPFAATDLALPATTIAGTVRSGDGPVAMAEVRLVGTGEAAFTDAAGRYALSGVEPGPRRLRVLAAGFAPAEAAVTVPGPGAAATADVSVTAEVQGAPAGAKAGG